MKIFLSWSGQRSRGIARILKGRLPLLMNAADPWMSETDIEKGERWGQVLSNVLDKAKVGIFCLTPSNVQRPALLFEAGAISKSVSEARACVLLDQLQPQNLIWPWTQFQYTKLDDQIDMAKMLSDLNGWILEAGEPAVAKERFPDALDLWWPKFHQELSALPTESTTHLPERSERDILEEILENLRQQGRNFSSLPATLGTEVLRSLADSGLFAPAKNKMRVRLTPSSFEQPEEQNVRDESVLISLLRRGIASALEAAGHDTASRILLDSDISLDAEKLVVKVPIRKTMAALTFNGDAEQIALRTAMEYSAANVKSILIVPALS